MNGVEWVALIVGGGLGAGARYLVDGAIMRGRRGIFPVGILVVNVIGSFLLGLLTGIPHLAPAWLAILGTGVLGGFTTFSSVAVETVLLAQRRRPVPRGGRRRAHDRRAVPAVTAPGKDAPRRRSSG